MPDHTRIMVHAGIRHARGLVGRFLSKARETSPGILFSSGGVRHQNQSGYRLAARAKTSIAAETSNSSVARTGGLSAAPGWPRGTERNLVPPATWPLGGGLHAP